MKFKKELRWLCFMLIPFTILLNIHYATPLAIVLEVYPKLEDYYSFKRVQNEQVVERALSLAFNSALSNFVESPLRLQSSFQQLLANISPLTMEANTQNIRINNAYDYSQQIMRQNIANATQSVAMWFARGIHSPILLTNNQSQLLQLYTQASPFLPSNIITAAQQQAVYSLSTYLVSNQSQMYFEYPSRYSQNLSDLASPTLDLYYTSTLQLYQNLDSSDFILPFLQYKQTENLNLLVLCTIKVQSLLSIVSCLRTKAAFIIAQMNANDVFRQQQSQTIQAYLALTSTLAPTTILSMNLKGSQIQNSTVEHIAVEGLGLPLDVFLGVKNSLNQELNIRQRQQATLYSVPALSTSSYISLQFILIFTTDGYVYSDNKIDNVKVLVIPIVILIVLALLFSLYIISRLLNSVDFQLYKLDKDLKLTADGDINIIVTEHQGTQDIRRLTQKVKIINKLHRYSSQHYFVGHFSEKMLKYNEALQFMRSLHYDLGNLLENMGEACIYLEDWEQARKCLRESVSITLSTIEEQFGSIDLMMPFKKKKKVSRLYKQLQLILIRKLFKLNLFYLRYLQLKPTFAKRDELEQQLQKQQFEQRQKQYARESTYYLDLQNKALYPDFASFSECIIMLLFECKQFAMLRNISEANDRLKKALKVLEKYSVEYRQTTKALQQKGSKYRLFRKKNKITTHSRAEPDVLRNFAHLMKSKLAGGSKNPQQALSILFSGINVKQYTLSCMYLSILDIRRLVGQLKIDVKGFQSTQLFKQVMPYRTLHQGEVTKDLEPSLLKFPTVDSPGLEREFIFIYDCGKDRSSITKQELNNQKQQLYYQTERTTYLFDKLVKGTDRISILKYHTRVGVKVQCGLLIKQHNQQLLRQALIEAVNQKDTSKYRPVEITQAFIRAYQRVKLLKLQKVIVMFFRPIKSYQRHFRRVSKRIRESDTSSVASRMDNIIEDEKTTPSYSHYYSPELLGQTIGQLLQREDLRNMKVILCCGSGDNLKEFRDFFGLNEINRRIWSVRNGVNEGNNVVYVVQERHKMDLDRMLMFKAELKPDNNIFVL